MSTRKTPAPRIGRPRKSPDDPEHAVAPGAIKEALTLRRVTESRLRTELAARGAPMSAGALNRLVNDAPRGAQRPARTRLSVLTAVAAALEIPRPWLLADHDDPDEFVATDCTVTPPRRMTRAEFEANMAPEVAINQARAEHMVALGAAIRAARAPGASGGFGYTFSSSPDTLARELCTLWRCRDLFLENHGSVTADESRAFAEHVRRAAEILLAPAISGGATLREGALRALSRTFTHLIMTEFFGGLGPFAVPPPEPE